MAPTDGPQSARQAQDMHSFAAGWSMCPVPIWLNDRAPGLRLSLLPCSNLRQLGTRVVRLASPMDRGGGALESKVANWIPRGAGPSTHTQMHVLEPEFDS